jgi:hypothetical protein
LLTLLLMYILSSEEKSKRRHTTRPEVLERIPGVVDELEEKGLMSQGSRGSKSVYITGERG